MAKGNIQQVELNSYDLST